MKERLHLLGFPGTFRLNATVPAQPRAHVAPRGGPRPMRVLVVEDDIELAETVAVGLRREGMAIDMVGDGHDALARLDLVAYDVVVLDSSA